jgi:formylglycine-generating enzyme required for sulfatase activity
VDASHPVEQVSWFESNDLLGQYGLLLPTEAQWEYACRAHTTDTWFSGRDEADLRDYAYISWPGGTTTAVPGWTTGETPPSADGIVIHAPVGRLGMNGFGLHDVIGNLFEWCRDRQGLFSFPVTGGDSERIVDAETSSSRIFRGGSAFSEATEARTAFRLGFDPDVRQSILGLRASRALRN